MRHISLLRSLFFYPRGVYSTVFTQQQHQQRKCIRSSRTFFYVTFNNFNDFFHGNSLLIKMQTLKTENTLILRVRCVFSFSLSPSILPSFFCKNPSVEMLLTQISSLLCIHLHFYASVLWPREGTSGIKCAKKRQVLQVHKIKVMQLTVAMKSCLTKTTARNYAEHP